MVVGFLVGDSVGCVVEGDRVGVLVGLFVGDLDGFTLGFLVGVAVKGD